jgi:nucleoid-associated protein YgaU
VRRMIDGALATSIVVSSTLASPGVAVAAPADRAAVVVELDEAAEEAAGAEPVYHPRPAGDAGPNSYEPRPANDSPSTATSPSRTATTSPENEPATVPTAATYTVRPGDNFWTIAEQHLAVARDHPSDELDTDSVRAYWLRLVQANAGDLASDDPDLIWPGSKSSSHRSTSEPHRATRWPRRRSWISD